MERAKNIVIAILAALCVLMVYLNLSKETFRYTANDGVVSDTTRVVVYDTIKIIKPESRDSVVINYITERLPIEQDSAHLICETSKFAPDTNVASTPDSANVIIPITTKEYHGDGYDAWVSGYRPSLDSLNLHKRTTTITETVTVTKWKTRRWGLSAGAGMVVTPKGRIEPGIFIGATYTFWGF